MHVYGTIVQIITFESKKINTQVLQVSVCTNKSNNVYALGWTKAADKITSGCTCREFDVFNSQSLKLFFDNSYVENISKNETL